MKRGRQYGDKKKQTRPVALPPDGAAPTGATDDIITPPAAAAGVSGRDQEGDSMTLPRATEAPAPETPPAVLEITAAAGVKPEEPAPEEPAKAEPAKEEPVPEEPAKEESAKEEPEKEEPPPAAQPAGQPAAPGLPLLAAAAALALSAAALTQPVWSRYLSGPPAPSATETALRADVAALSAKLVKLEQPVPADPRIADLAAQLAAVKGELARVGDAAAARPSGDDGAAAVNARLQVLESRLAGLTAPAAAPAAGPSPALVLAAAKLRAALDQGRPFAAELKAVRDAGGGDAELAKTLDSVAGLAGAGAPTLAALTHGFAASTGDIVRAHFRGDEATWLDHVKGALLTLVTVRRSGDVAGDDVAATLARAEQALAAMQLSRAVDETAGLSGPAAAAAAPWLAAARARLAADAAAVAVTDRAIALLTAAAKGDAQ